MSSCRASRIVAGVLCALLAGGAAIAAETRFEVSSRETVAAVPGLQIVTVRDNVLKACYTLFIVEPVRQAGTATRTESTVPEAAAERDRQLSALSADYERALVAAMPGTLGPNALRYEWEGDKVQSDYELRLRERELTRLEEQIAQIATAPRLAVAGPAPCVAPPPTTATR